MSERVAIVGSREYKHLERVMAYVNSLPRGTVVITGAWDQGAGRPIVPCPGVDATAYKAAKQYGLVPALVIADWLGFGKAAGPIRNVGTVALADRIVAFHDGKSPGTADTIAKARAAGKPVEIIGDGE